MRKSMQWIVGGIAGAVAGLVLSAGGPLRGQQAPGAANEPLSIASGGLITHNPIRAALDKRITAQFKETSLRKAVEEVRRQIDANVVFDDQGLQNSMVDADELKVTLLLKGARAATAFGLMLEPHGLVCICDDEFLRITDRESQKKKSIVRLYSIGDVSLRPYGADAEDVGVKIANLIMNTVDRDVWEPNGGDGTIRYVANSAGLVVNAPPETQEGVESLLDGLRILQRRLPEVLGRAGLPDPKAFFTRRRVVVGPTGEPTPLPPNAELGDAKATAAEAKRIADTALLLALRLEAEKTNSPSDGKKK